MEVGRNLDRGNGIQFEPGIANAVDNYSPDIILFIGGNNDTLVTDWQTDLDDFIAYLASTGLPVVMTNIPQHDKTAPNWNRTDASADTIPTMNAYIGTVAAANSSWLTLVDINSVFGPTDLRTDGLHLNDAAQLVMGQMISSSHPLFN